MKIHASIIQATCAFAALLITGSALALTVPVAEDTCSSSGVLKAASGKAATLAVNSKQASLVRFNLKDLDAVPDAVKPGNIKSAILRLYVVSAKPATALEVHAVGSAWSETLVSSTAALPVVGLPVIATIPSGSVATKSFATVDVTAWIISAINSGNDFGFAITTNSTTAKVTLASKEGASSGYAAQLDIDANLVDGESGNVASGIDSLQSITSGWQNTAIGIGSLGAATSASNNTAMGSYALSHNDTGSFNTACGTYALTSSVGGDNNTSVGYSSLFNNSTGYSNTAGGYVSLYSNTTGYYNTGYGVNSLYLNTSGAGNTACGISALYENSSGSYNTACGMNALRYTTGNLNVAIGTQAGYNLTTGSNNVDIANAGLAGESATIRIGSNATQNRAFIGGIRGKTTGVADAIAVVIDSAGQLGTVSSSRRYKEDIRDMAGASERLLALRPVTFRYKKPYADGSKPVQFGLIAEEVAEAFPELAVINDKGQPETVKYQDIASILLNEFIKEHQRTVADHKVIENQAKTIAAQEKRIAEQDERMRALTERMAAMTQQMETIAQRVDGREFHPVSNSAPGSQAMADSDAALH